MREDLVPGNPFPDVRLPEHTGRALALSEIAGGQPLILCFVRGWWCPKEQRFLRGIVAFQDELEVGYARLVALSVDAPDVSAGLARKPGYTLSLLPDRTAAVARRYDLVHRGTGIGG